MIKEIVYWSVDLCEPEAELEVMKENRLRCAVATIHNAASEESSFFIVIALGAPDLTQKPLEFEVIYKYMWFCFTFSLFNQGARGGAVVKALRYKPAGRGFDSRWCQDFSL